jgi:hypothetical protein
MATKKKPAAKKPAAKKKVAAKKPAAKKVAKKKPAAMKRLEQLQIDASHIRPCRFLVQKVSHRGMRHRIQWDQLLLPQELAEWKYIYLRNKYPRLQHLW